MPAHKDELTTANLLLADGSWVNTYRLTDDQYAKALSLGIAELIKLGELDKIMIKGKVPRGSKPYRLAPDC